MLFQQCCKISIRRFVFLLWGWRTTQIGWYQTTRAISSCLLKSFDLLLFQITQLGRIFRILLCIINLKANSKLIRLVLNFWLVIQVHPLCSTIAKQCHQQVSSYSKRIEDVKYDHSGFEKLQETRTRKDQNGKFLTSICILLPKYRGGAELE